MSTNGSFDRLPAELRHSIWKLVLGDETEDPPTMVPFKTSRPYMLEEDFDEEEFEMDEDAIDEEIEMTPEQFAQIQRLAAAHTIPPGVLPPPSVTLPSNGVAHGALSIQTNGENAQGDTAAAAGPATEPGAEAATEPAPEANGETNGEENGDEDDGAEGEDDQEEDEEAEDDDADTDPGEFEPGNPYLHERAWDEEAGIPIKTTALLLLLINREARAIALKWIKERPYMQFNRNAITKGEVNTGFANPPTATQPPVLVRRFDPERDYLYVDRMYWRRFCDRLQMVHMMPPPADDDDDEDPPHDIGAGIKHLALPAFTCYQSVGTLGHVLQFLPNIESLACIWGALPDSDWKTETSFETVVLEGKPKTKVTTALLTRWDQVRISERISEEETQRRKEEAARIKEERQKEKEEKAAKKEARNGDDDGGDKVKDKEDDENDDDDDEDDEEDDDDDDEDDDDDDEGKGPIVAMYVRDATDPERGYFENGYLSNWMEEIYNELAFCELPEHVRDEEDGSVTLNIMPFRAQGRD